MPVSSKTSRIAVAGMLSPGSDRPPGNYERGANVDGIWIWFMYDIEISPIQIA